jgi:hypothetical protein
MRKLRIANAQKRDAEITFGGIVKKSGIHYTLPDNTLPLNIKVLKSDLGRQYEALFHKYGSDEALSTALIEENPEIDIKKTGFIVNNVQKILIDENSRPVYKVNSIEQVYNTDGTLKEEKAFTTKNQNIVGDFPISWTGKQIPIAEAFNKFIFAKKYQLTHSNGLTFDFLYGMAKELSEKKALMLLGAGPKGNEPLIFQENGRPYRAFLEGRINGDSYLLIMHISNLELKPVV